MGVAKDAVKTDVRTKTATVTHLAEVEADKLCRALNDKMLGARVLTAGGVRSEPKLQRWSVRRVLSEFADPSSGPSKAMVLLEAALFIAGLVARAAGADPKILAILSLLVVCLGHTLLLRAVCSILALRLTIHLLMFTVLVGAICLGQLQEAAAVALVVGASEWLISNVHIAVEAALQRNLAGNATHAKRVTPTGAIKVVPIQELRPGDVVKLDSSGVVPADGRVIESEGLSIDEASVTGEAMPQQKPEGVSVFSGTVVVRGRGTVKCSASAEDSFQGRMQRAVEDARSSTSQTEELVDRLAARYTPLVAAGAVAVALATGDARRGLAALVGACPCALVAAAPMVQACVLVRLLRDLRVLVKDARALESLAQIVAVGVDKTGTLTEGHFEVVDAVLLSSANGRGRDELFQLLAALESRDPHPLAASIVRAHIGCTADFVARGGQAALPDVTNFMRVESKGVWGVIDGAVVGAGSAKFLEAMAVDLPPEASKVREAWEATGNVFTALYMTIENDAVMMLRLEDVIRPDARTAVGLLRSAGVDVVLLTGDSGPPASAVARHVGVTDAAAGLTPSQKEAWVRHRQSGGTGMRALQGDLENNVGAAPLEREKHRGTKVVAMLGDGLNDSPALAAANVGVAIACGLQLTVDAADVVVSKGGRVLLRFAEAVEMARRGRRLMLQSIVLAMAIKLSVLALAASGMLTLSVGVLSDMGSLLLVLLNGLRPLRWHLRSTGTSPP